MCVHIFIYIYMRHEKCHWQFFSAIAGRGVAALWHEFA